MKIIRQPNKQYHYTMGPIHKPIAEVKPGELFQVETEDAMGGKVRTSDDLPSKAINLPYVNPQTGPIYIEGAEKGDTLVVEIKEIKPLRDYGVSSIVPYFGGLTSTEYTRLLHPPLEERIYIYKNKGDKFVYNERLTVPYEPFYGTISTAPELESISSLAPGPYGGNMDVRDICVGNEVHLPVFVKGALLFLGDVHANQGDGELCGSAIEIAAIGTLSCRLIKGKAIKWPRIVSPERIMTVGSARPMEDAARIAYTELVLWLEEEYGFDRLDAYQLLTQIGEMSVGNMVDTYYSMVAKCRKKYLG